MERNIEQALKENAMLEGCSRLLLACSGGADSSAMLDFFWRKAGEYGLTLYVAHFNHRLRGAESDRDEALVREQSEKRGLPLFVGSREVAEAAARQKISIEMAARQERYAFLEKTAEDLNARIATAHHAEDNLETMLLNLIRGTGLKGLCGIPPARGRIIRPLLYCTKEEILTYCQSHGVEFVTDSSNFSSEYSRNRIRREVIPVLKTLNPGLFETTTRTAKWLREDENLLSGMAASLLKEASQGERVHAEKLRLASHSVRRRAVASFITAHANVHPDSRMLEQTERILKGGRLQLVGSRFLVCRRGWLKVAGEATESLESVQLVEGDNPVGNRILTISRQFFTGDNKNLNKSSLSCDKIKGTLWASSRFEGAKFHPAGRNVGKTLKKLFWESGVPAEKRNSLVVLTDEEGVVWVEGFGPDERCKPQPGKECLWVNISSAE